jgi:hypothetical protein
MSARRTLLLLVLPIALAVVARGQVSDQSPFLPAAATGQPTAPTGAFELTGVIEGGRSVKVCVTRTDLKRSSWIDVGKTEDGIEVLSFDRKTDTVSIRAAGTVHTLRLKLPAVAGASPAQAVTSQVSVAPAAQIPLPPLTTNEEKEREARMLVSDLLEIGVQQRRQYEEAQKKKKG